MRAIDHIRQPSEPGADPPHGAHRQHRDEGGHDSHRAEFERAHHAPVMLRAAGALRRDSAVSLPVSHSLNAAAGSIETVIGRTAHWRGHRTASFAVVTI